MPAKDKDYNKKYYQENKDKILKQQKENYSKNKDQKKRKASEYQKSYYKRNKEKILKRNSVAKKIWYQQNKERILKEKKAWRVKMLGSLEYRFKRAIQTSKQRGIPFLLTYEQFVEVVSEPCYYCNFQLCSQVIEGSGIDRIDSSKPYEIGNVISCGHRCNILKNEDLTIEEAKAAIDAILFLRNKHEKDNKASGKDRLSGEGISSQPVHQDGGKGSASSS